MKKHLLAIAAGLLTAAAPLVAQAVPVTYDVTFGANEIDADGGVGSFVWDEETGSLSNFVWDFGGGALGAGGINDAAHDWAAEVFGGTRAQFVAEILTDTDAHISECSTGVSSCGAGFYESDGLFGNYISLWVSNGLSQTYSLTTYLEQTFTGTLSSVARQTTSVPEPGTLALFSLALGGLGLARRRRRA